MDPRLLASRSIGVSSNKKQSFTEGFRREEWLKILTDKCCNVDTVRHARTAQEQHLQDEMKQLLIDMNTHKDANDLTIEGKTLVSKVNIREQLIQCFIEMQSPFNYVDLTELMIEKITAEAEETGEQLNITAEMYMMFDHLIFVYHLYCKTSGRDLMWS